MKQPQKTAIEVTKEVTIQNLDNSATLLLAQLPDHCGELVENLSKEYQIPLWQMFCGILLAMHLEGRLSAFQLDPAWRENLRQDKLICDRCKQTFKPDHLAQKYCSEKCGVAANEEENKTKISDKSVSDLKLKLDAIARIDEPVRLMTDDSTDNTKSNQSDTFSLPTFIDDNRDSGKSEMDQIPV